MPRIVSVWVPQWPIHRWLAAQRRRPSSGRGEPIDQRHPFVLADASDTPRITAVNPAAAACRLAVGETLADARSRIGALQVRLAEPAADTADLERLARWATRYTPSVALFKGTSGSDGFFLDVSGASHLLGGEKNLLADLARRLKAFGLPARLAIAETPGTAWAVSHFARRQSTLISAEAEAEVEALAPLPIEALRLAPETALTLRRLGFKRVGMLLNKARAPFAARFEKELLKRLDQTLGTAPDPLSLIAPLPVYVKERSLLEPISTEEAILIAANRLMQDLLPKLEADGIGARALRLALYRVDGEVQEIDIALTLPTQNSDHVTRLLGLKLERSARMLEAGFGFETVSLAVTVAEPMPSGQHVLAATSEDPEREKRCTALLDALRQRLGPESVLHLAPVASHWPERSQSASEEPAPSWPDTATRRARPPLMLPRAEPADVIALLPDGPPLRLRWRGKVHTIAHAEGPERIAAEWWRWKTPQPTRDYYLVEDGDGQRLWLYREGLPGRETSTPRWLVQGLFP